jgi:multicomponent Na+:H+ antiporter subunit E
LRGLLAWTAAFGLLWWLISRGDASAWLIGLPAVVLAVLASARATRPVMPGISLSGLVAFVLLFVRESLRGGLDVARRVLTPALRIRPGFVEYRTRLTEPRARMLLINCISLLPGTLAADAEGDRIELHLLDIDVDPVAGLHQLEQAIADLFVVTVEKADD